MIREMKSYIKIYGPPLMKAVRALEKTAVDMPEYCIMDTFIAQGGSQFDTKEGIVNYFGGVGEVTVERCESIISKSREALGEYDFFFEWFTDPDMGQLNELIERIDESLKPLGVRYTITTE